MMHLLQLKVNRFEQKIHFWRMHIHVQAYMCFKIIKYVLHVEDP